MSSSSREDDENETTVQRQDRATVNCAHKPLFRGGNENLPQKIFSNVPNTWAFDTVSRRLHEDILERVIEDNREDFISKEG